MFYVSILIEDAIKRKYEHFGCDNGAVCATPSEATPVPGDGR